MAGKTKRCSLFSRLMMLMVLVLLFTSTSALADVDSNELAAVRQEVRQLKQMVNDLAAEVRRLKKEEIKEKDYRIKYQQELNEVRAEVTKLSDSPVVGLADTLGKLKFGGYGEMHANFTEGAQAGDQFDIHRMILYVGYDFADWIKFHSETELEHAFVNDGDGEVSLEQAYFDFLLSDSFNIRAGRILTPVGIINQTHEPTTFNGVERPSFAVNIIPTTWSSDGVGIFGSINPRLNYEAYVVAGLDGDKFTKSSGIRNGRIKERPSLNDPAFTARLDYHPIMLGENGDQSLRLGLSGYFGGLDNKDQGANSGKGGEIALTSADFEYSVSKFDFRGAIANININGARELTAGGGGVAEEIFGWYLEGAYHFMPESWKIGKLKNADATAFVRYDNYDTQHKMPTGIARDKAQDREEWTFGVNFYLTPNFVIKADYQVRNDAGSSDRDDLFNLGIGWDF